MDRLQKTRHVDRRILRTKKLLWDAILNLTVERKDFHSIQINEITEKANVARSTFYLHYSNKKELLHEALQYEYSKFVAEMSRYYGRKFAPFYFPYLLDYVRKNPRYFKIILSSVDTAQAYDQTRQYLGEYITSKVDFSIFNPEIPLDLLVYHISGTTLDMLSWWLKDSNKYTAEKYTEYFNDMLFQGLLNILNVKSIAEMDRILLNKFGNNF